MSDRDESKAPGLITRRQFVVGGLAFAGATSAYAYGPARHRVGVLEHDVFIHDLPAEFENFTVAQMSDFHFGPYDQGPIVEHAVNIVNDLKPSMVVLTGDFITAARSRPAENKDAAARAAIALSNLVGPCFASEGNHDSIALEAVRGELARRKITMLYNQRIALRKGDAKLWLCGLADVCMDQPDLNRTLPPWTANEPVIVLGHAPDYVTYVTDFAKSQKRRCDLMLCGHTHGGQINIPGLVKTMLPEWGHKYVHGPYQVESTLLYVNRGLGTIHLPMRLNAPPEITLFRFHRQAI